MAASSETPSLAENVAQSSLLTLKANQNLILDLDLTKYDGFLQSIVEYLSYSPFVIALNKSESVPLMHLFKSFSTGSYQKGEELVTFEIRDHKTHITKSRFCQLLKLPLGSDLIALISISNSAILEMFF